MIDHSFEGNEIVYRYGEYTVLCDKWNSRNQMLPDNKLYYVTKGEIFIRYGERVVTVRAGEMILIPADTKHDFFIREPAEKHWIHFSLRLGDKQFTSLYKLAEKIRVNDPERVEKLFLDAYGQRHGIADRLRSDAAISELVACYIDAGGISPIEHEDDGILAAIEYLESEYASELSLALLAEKAHLSPTHFGRKFRERTGLSPMKYATVIRVERARTLLRNSALSVSEIMVETGFTDPSYFSRTFKTLTGFSPRAFRERFLTQKTNKI